jgi:hypothetical protein
MLDVTFVANGRRPGPFFSSLAHFPSTFGVCFVKSVTSYESVEAERKQSLRWSKTAKARPLCAQYISSCSMQFGKQRRKRKTKTFYERTRKVFNVHHDNLFWFGPKCNTFHSLTPSQENQWVQRS